jgi:DNA-binding GntR family transcriptional regulator
MPGASRASDPPISFNRSLSDQVANRLRQAIQEGQLKPDQRLVEEDLARSLEMSRGPVRDALKTLETERLVVRYPNRGTFVTRLTVNDAEEVYTLRQALEAVAIEYAIKSATTEQVDQLARIVQQMAELRERDYTPAQATDIDLEFHHTLCCISGHSRVLAAWTAQRAQVYILIMTHRTAHPDDFRKLAVDYHSQLVDAIRRRDSRLASGLLHVHLAASLDGVVDALKETT